MLVRIKLNVRDVLLKKALEVMLSDIGYVLTEKLDECSHVITDCVDYVLEKRKTLYVLREEIKGAPCLVRPFSKAELDAVMRAFLKSENVDESKAVSGVYIDKKRLTVNILDVTVRLTEKEFQLFELLYENKGRTISDNQIISAIWNNETDNNSNIAAVYINYLRKKLDERLGKKLIYRVRGKGYMLKINEKDL